VGVLVRGMWVRCLAQASIGAAILGVACLSEPGDVPDRAQVAWLSGEAAAALRADGTFDVTQPELSGDIAEIDYELARRQTEAWRLTFGPAAMTFLADERGEEFDIGKLRLCSRAYYAARAYKSGTVAAPQFERKAFGPYWLVELCTRSGVHVVSVAASAYNTDLAIVDGRLKLPPLSGSQFQPWGIPVSVSQLPVSAERAVCVAYAFSGRRITKVPRLFMPPRPLPAYEARWRVVLDGAVEVKLEDGESASASVLWIGARTRTSVVPAIAVDGSPLQPVVATYEVPGSPSETVTFEPEAGRNSWRNLQVPAGAAGSC
jgi:hypothetical protein